MAELHLDPVRFDEAREAAVRAFTPKSWKLSDPQQIQLNLQMHAALSAALDVFLSPMVGMAIRWAADEDQSSVTCADDLLRMLVGEQNHAQRA